MATDIISTNWKDVKGLPYSIPIYINSGQSIADIQTASDALVGALDDVTGGVLQSVYVVKLLDNPESIKTEATAGANRKDVANFNFETGEREGFPHAVPAIMPSLVSGETVPNSGAVATYTALMATGATPVLPCDQSAKDLTGLRASSRGTRKYRKSKSAV